MSVTKPNTTTTPDVSLGENEVRKIRVMLKSRQSVDQVGKRAGQHNDLEHILCMYTNFQFDAVKTGIFSTHLNFSNLIVE